MSKKSRGRKSDVRKNYSFDGSSKRNVGTPKRQAGGLAPINTSGGTQRKPSLRDSVANALRQPAKPLTAWRDVNRQLAKGTPIPAQHLRKASGGNGVLSPQPKAKTLSPKTKLANPEHLKSPEAREHKKRVCKKRPEGHNPRRAGGGASKDWVPWC